MLDENTEAIVAMAWARTFGLADDAFVLNEPRLSIALDQPRITVIGLHDRLMIAAPPWALERAAQYTDEALLSVPGLLELAKGHRPHTTSVSSLLYADDYRQDPRLEEATVTADPQAVIDLLGRCAPDDVRTQSIQDHHQQLVLLDENELPVAGAAYSTTHGILADLAILEAVDARGTGAIEIATALAMHDALDAGLIPQLRVDVDADRGTAEALGFEQLGVLASVQLDNPPAR